MKSGLFAVLLMSSAPIALMGGDLAAAEIGSISQEEYFGARGLLEQGGEQELIFGQPVHTNETVVTTADGTTAIKFVDRSTLQVAPSSSVLLDEFVYDPATQHGEAVLNFTQGAFRFVTGVMITKDRMRFETPVSTLSIRGTDFITLVYPDGSTEVNVARGGVVVQPCGDGDSILIGAGERVLVCTSCEAKVGSRRPIDELNFSPSMLEQWKYSCPEPTDPPEQHGVNRSGSNRDGASGSVGGGIGD